MKFYPVTTAAPDAALKADYDAGRSIGNVQLGNTYLFFKEKRKLYYIAYSEMTRVFRRVMLVQTKMCCGKGNLEVENLVVCNEAGEVAQIQLPGARAGVILLEEVAKRAPHVQIGKPN
jgi:hypothetical protein